MANQGAGTYLRCLQSRLALGQDKGVLLPFAFLNQVTFHQLDAKEIVRTDSDAELVKALHHALGNGDVAGLRMQFCL